MPVATIQIYTGWSPQQKQQLLGSLQKAILESLLVPDDDLQLKIQEYDIAHVRAPKNTTKKYVLIEIALFEGRNLETKTALYKAINLELAKIDIKSNDIFIMLQEIPKNNFGIKGGKPAGEIY